jgi:hypothetical protein
MQGLLGLDGKLGPAPAGKTAGAAQHTGEKKPPKKTNGGSTQTVSAGLTEFHIALSADGARGHGHVRAEEQRRDPHNLRINGAQSSDIDPGSTFALKVTFTKPANTRTSARFRVMRRPG